MIVLNTCTDDFRNLYGSPMKVLIPSDPPLTRGTRILVRHPGYYSEYEVGTINKPVARILHRGCA